MPASDRWSSTAKEGTPTRGRKTLILNLQSHPNREKVIETNPDTKRGVEPRRRLAVNTDNFQATLEAKPSLSIMFGLYSFVFCLYGEHVVWVADGLHIP